MEKMNLKSQIGLLTLVLIAPIAGISAATYMDSGLGSVQVIPDRIYNTDEVSIYAPSSDGYHSQLPTPRDLLHATSSTRGLKEGQESSSTIEINASSTGEVRMERDSAEAKDFVGAEIGPGNVQSFSDLRSFAASELHADPNLLSMDFTNDKVDVEYREPGRLLGFLPVDMAVNVSVNSDGTIVMNYPWYRFLVVTNDGSLDSNVQDDLSTMISSTTPVVFNPSFEAKLAQRIRMLLNSRLFNSSGTASTTETSGSTY